MTDTPPTLVDFLHARLDEDARVAEAATSGPWTAETHLHRHTREPVSYEVHPVAEQEGNGCGGVLTASDAVHIARHDPARVLRDVEAKRELVARYEAMEAGVLTFIGAESVTSEYRRVILPQLAVPYADHPDYREEWRP